MKFSLLPVVFMVTAFAAHSANAESNCDALQSQIQAKIASAGVIGFTLTTVDVDAKSNGKVLGSCALGTKKIMYETSAPLALGKRSDDEPMLTECRDGSVLTSGNCKK